MAGSALITHGFLNGENMDEKTRRRFEELFSSDREAQHEAFLHFLRLTEQPVTWAYEVWDELLEKLHDKDNHSRAIAAQLLCALAKSDPQADAEGLRQAACGDEG